MVVIEALLFSIQNDAAVGIILGTDFPYTQFFPKDAKVIQVDIRGEHIDRRTRVDIGLLGDVGETIRQLLPHLTTKTYCDHLDEALESYLESRKNLDELATGEPGDQDMHPPYFTKMLNKMAAPGAIFTCDVGTPTVWAARYLAMNGKRCLLNSFNYVNWIHPTRMTYRGLRQMERNPGTNNIFG